MKYNQLLHYSYWNVQAVDFGLWENPYQEVSFAMGLEDGWHKQIIPSGQLEALRELSHVDVWLAPCFRGVIAEEVFVNLILAIGTLRMIQI